MKTLVLSGFFGFDNAGDEAILLALIQQLTKRGYRPLVLSANPEKTTKLYGVDAVNRMKPKEVLQAIKSSDGLISGGGSLLQDITSSRNSIYYLGVIQMALGLRKPVFVFAQGVGPLHRGWLKKFTGFMLNRVTYRSVRDEESKRLLESCGVKKPIDLTVDPVLGIESTETKLSNELRMFIDKKPITFSLRSWSNDDDMIPYYQSIIKELNQKGIPVLLLPFHQPSDTEFSKRVASSISHPLLHVVDKELSLEEMLTCIRHSQLVFGVRLHSLIFAASQETPFVGLSYDPKIDAFLSLYNKNPIATTTNFNSQSTLNALDEALQHSLEEKQRISLHNQHIHTQLERPLIAIDHHFLNVT